MTCATELGMKFEPLTVTVCCPEPATAVFGVSDVIAGTGLFAGALTTKLTAFDVPPPGDGVNTVIGTFPAVAMSACGTEAVSCVALTNDVTRATPFTRTSEEATKLVPFTVKVNAGSPAVLDAGEMVVIVGTGLLAALMVKVKALDV